MIGIDFSGAMLWRAHQAAAVFGVDVTFCRGDAEQLPLEAAAADVALVNGICN